MKKFLKKVFGSHPKKESPEKGFSTFLTTASEEERTNLLRQVVREANKDQRKVMDEARNVLSKEKTAGV